MRRDFILADASLLLSSRSDALMVASCLGVASTCPCLALEIVVELVAKGGVSCRLVTAKAEEAEAEEEERKKL